MEARDQVKLGEKDVAAIIISFVASAERTLIESSFATGLGEYQAK